jgi:hypothetical protein
MSEIATCTFRHLQTVWDTHKFLVLRSRMVELYISCLICLHGIVLNKLGTEGNFTTYNLWPCIESWDSWTPVHNLRRFCRLWDTSIQFNMHTKIVHTCMQSETTIYYYYYYTALLSGLGRSFFSFLILYTISRTPWTGDQPVGRPLSTHRTTQTQNKCTHYRHSFLEWDLNPPSLHSSERRQFLQLL